MQKALSDFKSKAESAIRVITHGKYFDALYAGRKNKCEGGGLGGGTFGNPPPTQR